MKKPKLKFPVPDPKLRHLPKRERIKADPVYAEEMMQVEGIMYQSLDPGDKELPEDGAWIQVLLPPNTEYTVEPLSCWFALPDESSGQRYYVRISTPNGPLWLWPHEYVILKDISSYIMASAEDDMGVKVNYLTGKAELKSDALFYLRSRGVPYGEALLMLLGEVKEPNFCYLTFPVEYQEMFAGIGLPILGARSLVLNAIDRQKSESEVSN